MQMTVKLDLVETKESTLRSEFFGRADHDNEPEVVLPGDIVLTYQRTRGPDAWVTAAQLIASIPAGVLTSLATDQIKSYLQGKNASDRIRSATILYIDTNGNPVTLHLDFADS